MKRSNWESSVKKWEAAETALIDGDIPLASAALVADCGYCEEFLEMEDHDDGCLMCPLSYKKLCHDRPSVGFRRPYWLFDNLICLLSCGRIPNTHGNRHKALMLCREILQGIYADMHDLEK